MTCEVMREQQQGSPVFDFPELGGNEIWRKLSKVSCQAELNKQKREYFRIYIKAIWRAIKSKRYKQNLVCKDKTRVSKGKANNEADTK